MDGQELSWRERGRLWLRLGIRLALAALAWLLLTRVGLPLLSLLMPFVLALCVAWLLNPLVRLLQRRLHLSRNLISILLILLIGGGGRRSGLLYLEYRAGDHRSGRRLEHVGTGAAGHAGCCQRLFRPALHLSSHSDQRQRRTGPQQSGVPAAGLVFQRSARPGQFSGGRGGQPGL